MNKTIFFYSLLSVFSVCYGQEKLGTSALPQPTQPIQPTQAPQADQSSKEPEADGQENYTKLLQCHQALFTLGLTPLSDEGPRLTPVDEVHDVSKGIYDGFKSRQSRPYNYRITAKGLESRKDEELKWNPVTDSKEINMVIKEYTPKLDDLMTDIEEGIAGRHYSSGSEVHLDTKDLEALKRAICKCNRVPGVNHENTRTVVHNLHNSHIIRYQENESSPERPITEEELQQCNLLGT